MPTVRGMARRGAPFRGVLFAGLMIDDEGPKLIEYNVRFGDPEAEVILARLTDDVLPLLEACAKGSLCGKSPAFSNEAALAVVMAARGYPGEPVRGARIRGLDDAERVPGVTVFHAGTRQVGDEIISDGGRVLAITARGRTVSGSEGQSLRSRRPHRLARGLLQARHRVARDEIGKIGLEHRGRSQHDNLSGPALRSRWAAGEREVLLMCLRLRRSTRSGVRPAAIAGTSMGAVIGAAYAAGLEARIVRSHILRVLRNRSDVIGKLLRARVGRFADLVLRGRGNPVLLDPEIFLELFWPAEMPEKFELLAIKTLLVHRFRVSNHIRQPGGVCRTTCGRQGRD